MKSDITIMVNKRTREVAFLTRSPLGKHVVIASFRHQVNYSKHAAVKSLLEKQGFRKIGVLPDQMSLERI